ncbi:MarR family transcriptional regulator [Cognatishimia sp. SS12]|uniref:MarR family winged helix-turn-helix transcriptional regulator n=1 Tax=Cognatishimia sp. SS12 TaxID=2979465 RepID=UPI00232F8848|nr:MarR family transcriptional regulator [Cognatishimia sp. SS12]MDC0738484.1 MarR family transcriptional regulator [Cognatishimia sp. SS12]
MTLPDFDLETFLPYQFSVIAEQLSKELAKRYRAQFDLGTAEWRILINLAYADKNAQRSSVKDIQARVTLDKPKVSRAVARLESRALLTKSISASDKRLLDLELTAEGRALVAQLVPIAQSFQAALKRRLSADLDQLSDTLGILKTELTHDHTV